MRHEDREVLQNHKMFQLMEHFGIHELHNYQLSQEITSRLLKYLELVTPGIYLPQSASVQARRRAVNHGFELGKQSLFRNAEGIGMAVTGRASTCLGPLLPHPCIATPGSGQRPRIIAKSS
jgi:hypothetical protein